MYIIGINWKPVWKHVWKLVWKQAPTPPPTPTPTPPKLVDGAGRIQLEPRWKQLQRRNEDDLEVVKILAEFLSRIS